MSALSHVRVCDFGGQLAGAGATKILASFGAEVIRVEDPVTGGLWDALRATGPYVDERRGANLGGGFNNHNVGKLGVTIDLRTGDGIELARELIEISDVVTENFAAGVMERLGLGYEELRQIRPDVIYLSSCGFGHTGPHKAFKTWGPIVQALSGLTFSCGLPDAEPAGYGFSYMDHGAAYYGALGVLAALHHRDETGEGQWVDLATTPAGIAMLGTAVLDWTVNKRPSRRAGEPRGNRSDFGTMSPHGIFPAQGDDRWVAIACRDDTDWLALGAVVGEGWCREDSYSTLVGRLGSEKEIEEKLARWTETKEAQDVEGLLVAAGVPASVIKSPSERIDQDAELADWGLFPVVDHAEMGAVAVEGMPVHLSETDWSITTPGPCLGEHNRYVIGQLLGRATDTFERLSQEGVI